MPCSESHSHTSPGLDTFLLCEDQCRSVMHHVSSSSPHSNNRVYSLVCSINYGAEKVLYYSATLGANGLLVDNVSSLSFFPHFGLNLTFIYLFLSIFIWFSSGLSDGCFRLLSTYSWIKPLKRTTLSKKPNQKEFSAVAYYLMHLVQWHSFWLLFPEVSVKVLFLAEGQC